ncbi:MAG TPA: hypothetical protein VKE22_24400 [Haliangiales bacterium]|nr:hypothetical protein [Haliangiales bacterium]
MDEEAEDYGGSYDWTDSSVPTGESWSGDSGQGYYDDTGDGWSGDAWSGDSGQGCYDDTGDGWTGDWAAEGSGDSWTGDAGADDWAAQAANADTPWYTPPGLPTGQTGQTPGPLAPTPGGVPGGQVPAAPTSTPSTGWFDKVKSWFTGDSPLGGDWKGGTPLGGGPDTSHDDPQTRDRTERDNADKADAARKGVSWPKMPFFSR